MIPIPWLIAGIAGYFLITGKNIGAFLSSAQDNKGAPASQKPSSKGGSSWENPSSQPPTANGIASTISDITNTAGAVASTVGKFVDWFNPPSAKSTAGTGTEGSRSGTGSTPPYLANSSDQSYENSGFKFWG